MNIGNRTLVFADESARWEAFIATDRRLKSPLEAQSVPRGIILPLRSSTSPRHSWDGGVITPSGTFVAGHTFNPTRTHRRNVVAGYAPDNVRYIPGIALYAGGIRPDQFGHFLTESLSRLWWIRENNFADIKIVFNRTYPIRPQHGNFTMLSHLGINPNQVLIADEPIQFDEVVIPDQAFFLGNGQYHPKGMKLIYDHIRDSVPPGSVEKVYLTRRNLKNKTTETREINEEMLEDFYRDLGYQIVSPETLPLNEQIALLAGAKEVASTAGTLSHLSLFSRNGVKQTILLRHAGSLRVSGQWGISQFREVRTRVVDALVSLLPGSHTVGVVYFAATEYFTRYAKQVHHVKMPQTSFDGIVVDYMRNWAELVAATPTRFLNRYPEWSLADLVESIQTTLTGQPLEAAARARLISHFVKHEPETRRPSHDVILRFNSNGGTPVPDQDLRNGGLASRPDDPVREGFSFGGWFSSPRLREAFDFTTPVRRAKTLDAKWISAKR